MCMKERIGMKQNKEKQTKVIGVMGGVGSGKTELLNYLESQYGAIVIMADRVAEMLMQPGTETMDSLRCDLPPSMFLENGEINKNKMAEHIFQHPEERLKINQVVHPAVVQWIIKKLTTVPEGSFVVLESALLIEARMDVFCDEVWYIYADKEMRIRRLIDSRGYSMEKIQAIMDAQCSDQEFLAGADAIIDNTGDICKMKAQVDALLLVREK